MKASRNDVNFPIALVLPSLEGRSTIKETLHSLEESIDLFDHIIISVNGLSAMNANMALSSLKIKINSDVHILCTEQNLGPVKHFDFIRQKLQSIVPAQAWLLILADDDLLAPRQNLIQYFQVFRNTKLDKVGMGNFMTFSESQPQKFYEKQHIAPGESISPVEFLRRNNLGNMFSNISSMIVSHKVFRDSIAFMLLWGSAGRRLEYIWETHRSVKKLICPLSATVFIREHPLQLGRTLSHESSLRDEWIYIIWIWRNQPSLFHLSNNGDHSYFSFMNFLRLSLYLLRRRLGSVPALRSILRAPRASQ